jgi:hypothetical protein
MLRKKSSTSIRVKTLYYFVLSSRDMWILAQHFETVNDTRSVIRGVHIPVNFNTAISSLVRNILDVNQFLLNTDHI